MSEHHEFCQLRIDGLKDTIATLTAQRDAEQQTKTWLRKRLTDAEQTARTYAAQRDAAEKELEHARLWGFGNDVYNWYEDLIEWLGDWHDEELCDGPQDLIAQVKGRFVAAEKVCEAAERYRLSYEACTTRDIRATNAWVDFAAALIEWYRTKEGA